MSHRHQNFDSNGPSIRIRGNAHQVYEKYLQLARDANVSGDRVAAENMYQHAEHYFRLINAEENQGQQPRQQNRGNGADPRQPQQQTQPESDKGPAPQVETDNEQPPIRPAPVNDTEIAYSDGNVAAGAKDAHRGNGADGDGAADADTADNLNSDAAETVTPRPQRRPRRGAGRPRNGAPTAKADEQPAPDTPVAVESDAATESSGADADVEDLR